MNQAVVQRRRRLADGPPAVELLEEAVHLLRRAPLAAWAVYAAGAVPWVVGFLYFWARMSWFAPSGPERAWAALWLAGAFVALKTAQADFAARLYARRAGTTPEPAGVGRFLRLGAAQLRLQTWGWFALPLAAVATVPFGWAMAFFQNVSVVGATPEEPARLRRESWKLAALWPKQNHVLLIYVGAASLVVWVNLLTCAYLLPWLARTLLGVENFLALRGFAALNTTLLAFVTMLAWLATDPLVKAIYVLRVFHGRAQHTGDDLREAFPAPRRPRAPARIAAPLLGLVLAGAVALSAPPTVRAAATAQPAAPTVDLGAPVEPPAPVVAPPPAAQAPRGAIDPAQFDRALDETLRGEDFQWSLRPLPGADTEKNEGAVAAFFRRSVEWVREQGRAIQRAWLRFRAWLDSFGDEKKAPPPEERREWPRAGGFGGDLARVLIYVLLAAVAVALGWAIVSAIRQARRQPKLATASAGGAPVVPDLRDENVTAAQLPSDGWLDLARQKIAAGEWRLALRALYLSTLARLADEELITLAKHKTNLDYEREVARRALTHVEIVERFRGRRRAFEDVWYGEVPAGEAQVRAWLEELERTAPVAPPAAVEAAPAR